MDFLILFQEQIQNVLFGLHANLIKSETSLVEILQSIFQHHCELVLLFIVDVEFLQ